MAGSAADAAIEMDGWFIAFVGYVKSLLEDEDASIRGHLEAGKTEASIFDAARDNVFHIMDTANEFLNHHVHQLTPDEHVVYEKHFRNELNHLSAGAAIFHRALMRPLGYAGDYVTMRMCYDNGYEGTTLLGKIMHKYAVEMPSGEAVRYRRNLIAQFAEGRHRILSVACGPASEVKFVAGQYPEASFDITLLDQDKEALDFAASQLRDIDNAVISYVTESVYSMIKSADAQLGSFDLIYSMGLFDYLQDKAARILCCKLAGMLRPNGILVIGNYHVRSSHRYSLQYWGDWPLNYRTNESMLDMTSTLGPEYRSTILHEESQAQMFLKVHRVVHSRL